MSYGVFTKVNDEQYISDKDYVLKKCNGRIKSFYMTGDWVLLTSNGIYINHDWILESLLKRLQLRVI